MFTDCLSPSSHELGIVFTDCLSPSSHELGIVFTDCLSPSSHELGSVFTDRLSPSSHEHGSVFTDCLSPSSRELGSVFTDCLSLRFNETVCLSNGFFSCIILLIFPDKNLHQMVSSNNSSVATVSRVLWTWTDGHCIVRRTLF